MCLYDIQQCVLNITSHITSIPEERERGGEGRREKEGGREEWIHLSFLVKLDHGLPTNIEVALVFKQLPQGLPCLCHLVLYIFL